MGIDITNEILPFQGIFGAMVKDLLGNKSSQSQQPNDLNFSVGTSEEHFDIFSTDNFPQDDANKHCSVKDEDVELDIGIIVPSFELIICKCILSPLLSFSLV